MTKPSFSSKSGWFVSGLLLLLPVILLSCLTEKKDDVYVVSFKLDSNQLGQTDSLRFEIYNGKAPALGDSTRPVQIITVRTPKGVQTVEIKLSDKVNSDFSVVVIGIDSSGVVQRKLFEFADFGTEKDAKPTLLLSVVSGNDLDFFTGEARAPAITVLPADAADKSVVLSSGDTSVVRVAGANKDTLKAVGEGRAIITITARSGGAQGRFTVNVKTAPVGIRLKGIASKALRGLVGDTLVPELTFDPADATDRGFTLRSLDTTMAVAVGNKIVTRKLGTGRVEVTATDGGARDTFDVAVVRAGFKLDVLPITSLKCNPCHIPGQVFDFQDSLVLIRKGSQALDRLRRHPDAAGKMPLKGAPNGDLSPRELAILLDWLGRNVVPLTGFAAKDMQMNLGDTSAPDLAWTPADASNQVFTLTSIDSAVVSITSDNRLLPLKVGQATVLAESDEGRIKAQFKVNVAPPSFNRNILPITTIKCAPCHVPGQIFNFQDSSLLILEGTDAMARLQRDSLAAGKMPLRGAPNGDLTPHQKSVLLAWLTLNVIPLKGIAVGDDSLLVGQQKAPNIVYDPPNANNKAYFLASTDTAKVGIDGDQYFGREVGSAQVEVRALDGNHLKIITVKVKPVPVDSLAAHDTLGAIGDTVFPRVEFFPASATSPDHVLSLLRVSTVVAVAAGGKSVVGLSVGKDTVVASTPDGRVKSRLVFTVGPVLPRKLVIRDTNTVIAGLVTPTLVWTPANTTTRTFTLSIAPADTNIAAVRGVQVLGKALGKVSVVGTSTEDPAVKDTFGFTVGPVPVISLTMAASTQICSTVVNGRSFIGFNPANATNKKFLLSLVPVSPARLRLVSDTTIQSLRTGPATVTVRAASDTSIKATWSVNVVRPSFTPIKNITAAKCINCHSATVQPSLNWQEEAKVVLFRLSIKDRITVAATGTRMPPSTEPQLTAAELKALYDWVNIE